MSIDERTSKIKQHKNVESVHSIDVMDNLKTLVVQLKRGLNKDVVSNTSDTIQNILQVGTNCVIQESISGNYHVVRINYENNEAKKSNTPFVIMTGIILVCVVIYIYLV